MVFVANPVLIQIAVAASLTTHPSFPQQTKPEGRLKTKPGACLDSVLEIEAAKGMPELCYLQILVVLIRRKLSRKKKMHD